MSLATQYIRVLLPLAFEQKLFYSVPDHLVDQIEIGKRVEVQMGKHKIYAAIIIGIGEQYSNESNLKAILSVLDDTPIITEKQLAFWQWVAQYYLCTLGEVMQAALPAAFKLSSETVFVPSNLNLDELSLSDKEMMIVQATRANQSLSGVEIQELLGVKGFGRYTKQILEKGYIERKESLRVRYKPKVEKYIGINSFTDDELSAIYKGLNRAPKQQKLLIKYLDLLEEGKEIKKSHLIKYANSNQATLKQLVRKEILNEYEKKVDRVNFSNSSATATVSLNHKQQKSFENINDLFEEIGVVLLHGVTASGKTHIYLKMIQEVLERKGKVLLLVPEIALTSQLIDRIIPFVPNLLVYHSRFTDAEQVEIWEKVHQNKSCLIVGTRSAIFLPFKKLDLIIVDEEHDASYKQQNPDPRYNARDCAVYLSKFLKTKTLLGSATPSIESLFNTRNKKYGFVELKERFTNVALPKMEFIDLIKSRKKKQFDGVLSLELKEAIQQSLDNNEQIIIFQNRRGYAPYLQCIDCGDIPHCQQCDVSLTYHRFSNDLRCHYCGYRQAMMNSCQQCKGNSIELKGLGTEKVEDELSIRFPMASIERMDYDTTRSKFGHKKIIDRFQNGDVDILVGTQMVTKGLDFNNVGLVAVLNVDGLWSFPTYRVFERAYQTLIQVSGRAGRDKKQGLVLLQTNNINHPILDFLQNKSYNEFYKHEIADRRFFRYPPFIKLIKLTLLHEDYKEVDRLSFELKRKLGDIGQIEILGPVIPGISKIKNRYIRELYLKFPRNNELRILKSKMSECVKQYKLKANKLYIKIDVDC